MTRAAPVKISPAHATRHNPIIGDAPADTLYLMGCAVSFLARTQSDYAEASQCGSSFCSELSSNQHRGFSLLLGCVESAVWFELEGRQ